MKGNTQNKRVNPLCEECLFQTEENIPEHRQYTITCPQWENTNHTRDKAGAINKEEDMQMASTAALLKSTEN